MNICIFGGASDELEACYMRETEEGCRQLAQRGHTLVFGGGNGGMMGAAARGFRKENKKVIGVAPEFFHVDGVLFEDCTEFVYTQTMRERKQYMEEHSDLFLVMPGGVGTMDEFFESFTLYTLSCHQKPVVLMNLFGYYDCLLKFLREMATKGSMKQEKLKELYVAETFVELLKNKDLNL